MNSQSTSELAEWHEFNQETVAALIEDGSDASQAHTIEYHFASDDFDALEKAAVDAFPVKKQTNDTKMSLVCLKNAVKPSSKRQ